MSVTVSMKLSPKQQGRLYMENTRLKQENQQLKQRIAELELMVQVERLKNGLCDLTAESISHEAMSICRELINCTPKQALAEQGAKGRNEDDNRGEG